MITEIQTARIAKRLDTATAAFEKGFASEAARKEALRNVSSAFEIIRAAVTDAILAERGPLASAEGTDAQQALTNIYYDMPFNLHQIRDQHFAVYAAYPEFEQVRDLIEFRNAIKAAEIIRHERPANEARVEAIRKSIFDQMAARKEKYVRELDLAHHFGGMRVSVNAHMVYGHKGAVFPRYFFFLNGEFTALQTIMAIADQLEREGR